MFLRRDQPIRADRTLGKLPSSNRASGMGSQRSQRAWGPRSSLPLAPYQDQAEGLHPDRAALSGHIHGLAVEMVGVVQGQGGKPRHDDHVVGVLLKAIS